MNSNLKKLAPQLFGVLALSCTVQSYADTEMNICKLESQMRDIGTTNARGTYGANLADASPNTNGYGFYISADAVVYQLIIDNNQYGISSIDTSTATDNAFKTYKTTFDWRMGFKTGIGYYSAHDFWQSGFEFTYLQTHTSSNGWINYDDHTLNMANALLETNTSDGFGTGHQYAHVNFYNLDWTVGKNFFASHYLSFMPEVGLKSTWFHQKTKNTWGFSPIDSGNTQNRSSQDYYWGIGPKVDLQANLYLDQNFSLFGKVETALLFANNTTSYTNIETNEFGEQIDWYSSYQTKKHISPYLGFNLGVAYDTNFKDDSFNLGIKLSYEQQYYNKASRLLNQDAPSAYDVSLQGVDLSFVFSF